MSYVASIQERRTLMGDASHSFESYYKRAVSPLIVLQLLRNRVMYGYELSQAMPLKSALYRLPVWE